MPQKEIRVVVAEDTALVSEMIQGMLEDIGCSVIGQAENGIQAVDLTQTLSPDVILMDIEMPGIDGIEATRQIFKYCPTPVVVLTAYETPELIEQVSTVGAGAYLVKPPDAREMERAIAIAIARFKDLMELRRMNTELQAEIARRREAENAIKQQNHELTQLNAIIATITSTLTLEQVLLLIVKTTHNFFPNTSCVSIQLLNENDELCTQVASDCFSNDAPQMLFRADEGIAGWSFKESRPINIHDVTAEPRFLYGSSSPNYRSLLVVPLISQKQTLGTLSINAKPERAFSSHDEQLLQGLAEYAAIAVQNARTFEHLTEEAKTKSILLREVSHRFGNNMALILSLLSIKRRSITTDDPTAYKSIVQDLANHVHGLSTVHKMLSTVNWSPLCLTELTSRIIRTFLRSLPSNKQINVIVPPASICVTSKQANYIALIINELTTNTVKYAMENRDKAQITVRITFDDDKWIRYEFRDDGPGYPEDVLLLENINVGLNLVQMIVTDSLDGELSLHNDNGAVAVIRFEAL